MEISNKLFTPAINEKSKPVAFQEKELDAVSYLFKLATEITTDTPQREICNLLSLVADYSNSVYKICYSDEVHELQKKLSNCLKSKYTGQTEGFEELKLFLDSHNELILSY